MACTPFNYSNYGTGNASCSSHRDACSTNRATSLTTDFGSSGKPIRAADVENLRANIINELAAWNAWNTANGQGAYSVADPGSVTGGRQINYTNITQLNNDLAAIVNYTASSNTEGGAYTITNNGQITNPGQSALSTGNQVTAPQWNAILTSYNTIRQDCICNSDCHCNTVCTCYGNCGCNYSDERLKENIVFLEEKNGLRLYSWNYLWDKVTRHIGVMAQELLQTQYKSAVVTDRSGYYMVDYTKLPI